MRTTTTALVYVGPVDTLAAVWQDFDRAWSEEKSRHHLALEELRAAEDEETRRVLRNIDLLRTWERKDNERARNAIIDERERRRAALKEET